MNSNAIHLAAHRHGINVTSVLALVLLIIGCDTRAGARASELVQARPSSQQQPHVEGDSAFEATQTQKVSKVRKAASVGFLRL